MRYIVQSNFSKGFQDCSTFSIEPNPSCKWGKLGFLLFQGWQAEIYQARSYMHIIWLFVGNVAGFLCNFCSLTLHKGSFILLLFWTFKKESEGTRWKLHAHLQIIYTETCSVHTYVHDHASILSDPCAPVMSVQCTITLHMPVYMQMSVQ